jgi:hypothetical protein
MNTMELNSNENKYGLLSSDAVNQGIPDTHLTRWSNTPKYCRRWRVNWSKPIVCFFAGWIRNRGING